VIALLLLGIPPLAKASKLLLRVLRSSPVRGEGSAEQSLTSLFCVYVRLLIPWVHIE
jgi:hypothetical protein